MENNSLERFIVAQEHAYAMALREIRGGRKQTHWMWFIFPQLRGLGTSYRAFVYGIEGIDEARAYIEHPVLSSRLIEISEALLSLEETDPVRILGHVDAVKLRSSMTLFALISDDGSVFYRVLDKLYGGQRDEKTLELLGMR